MAYKNLTKENVATLTLLVEALMKAEPIIEATKMAITTATMIEDAIEKEEQMIHGIIDQEQMIRGMIDQGVAHTIHKIPGMIKIFFIYFAREFQNSLKLIY